MHCSQEVERLLTQQEDRLKHVSDQLRLAARGSSRQTTSKTHCDALMVHCLSLAEAFKGVGEILTRPTSQPLTTDPEDHRADDYRFWQREVDFASAQLQYTVHLSLDCLASDF